jgi:hypothetical protein
LAVLTRLSACEVLRLRINFKYYQFLPDKLPATETKYLQGCQELRLAIPPLLFWVIEEAKLMEEIRTHFLLRFLLQVMADELAQLDHSQKDCPHLVDPQ